MLLNCMAFGLQEDLHIIRRVPPAHAKSEGTESPKQRPAHMPTGLRRLSQKLKPRIGPTDAPSTPTEHAAASSAQEAPARNTGGLESIRRGFTCLSGRPAAARDEPQGHLSSPAQESAHVLHSECPADSQGSAQQGPEVPTKRHHAQPEAFDSAASLAAGTAASSSLHEHSVAAQHRAKSGSEEPFSASDAGLTASSDGQGAARSSDSAAGNRGTLSGSKGSRRRAHGKEPMHPMLAAILRLAEDAAGAHGEAALQKLAAICSICQAGLAGDRPSSRHIAGRMNCFGHMTHVNHADVHTIYPAVLTAEVPKPASVISCPNRARAAASTRHTPCWMRVQELP